MTDCQIIVLLDATPATLLKLDIGRSGLGVRNRFADYNNPFLPLFFCADAAFGAQRELKADFEWQKCSIICLIYVRIGDFYGYQAYV
jgi:hypothetical protein